MGRCYFQFASERRTLRLAHDEMHVEAGNAFLAGIERSRTGLPKLTVGSQIKAEPGNDIYSSRREKLIDDFVSVGTRGILKEQRRVTEITMIEIACRRQHAVNNASDLGSVMDDREAVPLIEDVLGGAEIQHDIVQFPVPIGQRIEIEIEQLGLWCRADIERVVFDVGEFGDFGEQGRTLFRSRRREIG